MITIGILLIIVGALMCAFGMAQNTILYSLFADLNSQLVRATSGIEFSITWLFFGPGTIVIIVGTLIIALGIFFIVKGVTNKKRIKKDEPELTDENLNS